VFEDQLAAAKQQADDALAQKLAAENDKLLAEKKMAAEKEKATQRVEREKRGMAATLSHMEQKFKSKLAATVSKLEAEHNKEKDKINDQLNKKESEKMVDRSKNEER